MGDMDRVRAKYEQLRWVMNERVTRLWAAAEAESLGHGGIAANGVQSKMAWLSFPDPCIAPAVLAVDRALAWYIGEVPLAEQPPISLAQAEHLREVLAGTRPRANEQFEIIVNFARTMYRFGQLDPSVPRVNLGDTLTALPLVPRPGEARWIFDARIDGDAFAKLQ